MYHNNRLQHSVQVYFGNYSWLLTAVENENEIEWVEQENASVGSLVHKMIGALKLVLLS